MRIHRVTGGGGVGLHVTDQGPETAPAILLIHGWAQGNICWQTQAPLAEKFRLVALDLRGHGLSDAPQDVAAYTDTALWAQDIQAVIDALGLKNPILVGWSYGARVIASYLTTYGDAAIAGFVTVGGILAIGTAREDWMADADNPGLNRDLYTNDDARRTKATTDFVAACTEEPLPPEMFEALVAVNMTCTALVRRALFAANWDLRPTFAATTKPALVIHGVEDRVVAPINGITASEIIPNADLLLYENAGHALFLEQPDRFNKDLTAFATLALGAAQ